jgi:hypothetical protein
VQPSESQNNLFSQTADQPDMFSSGFTELKPLTVKDTSAESQSITDFESEPKFTYTIPSPISMSDF